MARDYYEILGLSRTATREEIRARFLELARTRHPDRFQGADKEEAETDFQAITQAFNVLSNPEQRRQHDLELSKPQVTQQAADKNQVARVYLTRGVHAYRDKKYREAAENFERAAKETPDDGRAWHHLARSLAHQPRYLSRAAASIRKACELEPMNTTYLKIAGRIHARAGLEDEARGYYDQARVWGADEAEIDALTAELDDAKGRKRGGLFGKVGS